MDEKILQEILDALFSSLESMEAQSAGVSHFLRDKGIASDETLAPYIEQAGNAASVRWRAARVRIEHLLTSAMKEAQKGTEDSSEDRPKPRENKDNPPETQSLEQQSGEKPEAEKEGVPNPKRGQASNDGKTDTPTDDEGRQKGAA